MPQIEPIAPPGLHEMILKLVDTLPGDQVLDAPAGYGALTQKLLERGKYVTAADIDTGKFIPDRSNGHLQLVQFDMNDVHIGALGDDRFDIVVCAEGVEHLKSQWTWLANIHRALKPGGHLVISTPNILNFRSRIRYFMEGRYEHFKRPLVAEQPWEGDHIAPVSYFELQLMLESTGFVIKELHTNALRSKNIFSVMLRPMFNYIYRNKNNRDARRNRGEHGALYDQIMSDPLYFGECLIIIARKQR
jgi:SAM-dependent methyltransferase